LARAKLFRRLTAVLGISLLAGVGCPRDREVATGTVEAGGAGLVLLPPETGPMASPVRLAMSRKGDLLVSDSRLEKVMVLDPVTLQPVRGFRVSGRPLAVGVGRNAIYVGNARKRTVEVYDPRKGTLKSSFGPGAVAKPTDLAVDLRARLVFVLDAGAMDVKVFDLRGRPQGTISGPGTGPAQLTNPTGIAVDEARAEVYVSQYGVPGGNAAIKIFSYDGAYLGEISGAGQCGMLGCSGGFSRPEGMWVEGRGRIYLADGLLAEVLIIDRASGEVVGTLGGRDIVPTLRFPTDVAIGREGDVYVTSVRTGTVEVFPGGGWTP
jgi:DNA-binding beta-propeller fold protein YncE